MYEKTLVTKPEKKEKRRNVSRMWEFFYSTAKLYLLLHYLHNTTFKLSFQLCWHRPLLQMFYPGQNPAFTLTLQLCYNGSLYQQMEIKGTVLCFNSGSHIYFHCNEIGCWFIFISFIFLYKVIFLHFWYKSQNLHPSENESHVLIRAWMCYHIWCVWEPLQKKNHVCFHTTSSRHHGVNWGQQNCVFEKRKKKGPCFSWLANT